MISALWEDSREIMYTSNINFIKKMVKDGHPPYNIVSFLCDTVDAMRTGLVNVDATEEQRRKFEEAMSKIVEGLSDLDVCLDECQH